MRTVILPAIASAIALFPAAGPQLKPLAEAGYRRVIDAHKGTVLLVDFWATWCSPCLEELPLLVRLGEKYRGKGLRLVTISCDETPDEPRARQLIEKHKAQPGYLKRAPDDEKFINSVDPKWSGALPGLFLYDRRGRLVRSFIGEADMTALESAIRQLL